MTFPTLTIIAGCNGSGKSSFSSVLASTGFPSFDYDKVFLEKYNTLQDSEIRDDMAHTMAWQYLENAVDNSINTQSNFTYETNFNSTPLYWPERFKIAGFNLRLIYFCLDSIEEAKRRVQIRVENGGHSVPGHEIIERYYLGFKNLDENWKYFDEVYLFDTSTYNKAPRFILSIMNEKINTLIDFPQFLSGLIPGIKSLDK